MTSIYYLVYIVTGSDPRDHPMKKWLECVRNNLKVKCLETPLAQNKTAWRWALNPVSRQ